MSTLRLLVGTREGAFILTAQGDRRRWTLKGPLFGVPLFASSDEGDSRTAIADHLPRIHSVEVQTIP